MTPHISIPSLKPPLAACLFLSIKNTQRTYVEIKCKLDATDEFLLHILLLAQHVSGTIMPIIRSSRVLYRWLLPVVFGALVFKLSVWCGAEGYVSGLRAADS